MTLSPHHIFEQGYLQEMLDRLSDSPYKNNRGYVMGSLRMVLGNDHEPPKYDIEDFGDGYPRFVSPRFFQERIGTALVSLGVVEEDAFVVDNAKREPVYRVKRTQISNAAYQRYVKRQIRAEELRAATRIAELHRRFDVTYQ